MAALVFLTRMKMKKIVFAALLMVCPMVAAHAAEYVTPDNTDTLTAKTVDAKTIKAENQKWEVSPYLNIGFNTMLGAPSGYDFNLWPSFDVGFGVKGEWMPYGKKNVWSMGFGVNWRYYRMDNATRWQKDATTAEMTLVPYLATESDRRTSLTAFSLQVPITYTHYFDKEQDWGVTLGGIVNFNTGAHVTREYTFQDEDYEVETGSIHQRPVTIDGLLMVHMPGDFALYCKYCPMKYFRDGYGPKMNQLSFGIYF